MRAFLRPWTTGWRRSPITSCSVTTWLCRRTDQQDQGAQAPLLWHLQPGPSLPASVSGSGRLSHVCAQRGLIPLYMESSTGSIREPQFGDTVDPPDHGIDGLQTQPLVDLSFTRIIQAHNHAGHPKHLSGQTSSYNIDLITTSHCRQAIGSLDASLEKHLAVEASTIHGLAFERGTEPFEGEGVFIYHGHCMTALAERLRQSRAHTAAANN